MKKFLSTVALGAAIITGGFSLSAPTPAAADGFFADNFLAPPTDGRFLIRGRVIVVAPTGTETATSVSGSDVDVGTGVVPEVDFTFFFTKNIAAELIAAVTPHELEGRNGPLGNVNLGDALLLPPTLTLQYHFTQFNDRIKPYIGFGVNYTTFFTLDDGVAEDISFDDSFGFAGQFGIDYKITDNVYFNVDIKYIDIQTDAEVTLAGGAGTVTADVNINPIVVGVGLGYRF